MKPIDALLFLWDWFNLFLTVVSLILAGLALYRQLKGTDVVNSSISFQIKPLWFESLESPKTGYECYRIHFVEMGMIDDVGKCFLPKLKEVPTNFDVTVNMFANQMLDSQILIQIGENFIPLMPGSSSSLTTAVDLSGTDYINLCLLWKTSSVMPGVIDRTTPFGDIFPYMNLSLLCFA